MLMSIARGQLPVYSLISTKIFKFMRSKFFPAIYLEHFKKTTTLFLYSSLNLIEKIESFWFIFKKKISMSLYWNCPKGNEIPTLTNKRCCIGPKAYACSHYKDSSTLHDLPTGKEPLCCFPKMQSSYTCFFYSIIDNPFIICFLLSKYKLWKLKCPNLVCHNKTHCPRKLSKIVEFHLQVLRETFDYFSSTLLK